jgi:group II intron reverse transcriptase/maturase
MKNKPSNLLKDTIENFRQTHVTAKWQTLCFTMTELNIIAEGRSEKNLKYIARKPCVGITLRNQCLEKKRTKLLLVKRIVGNYFSTSSENLNIQKSLSIYKTATQKSNLYKAFKNLKVKCAPGLDGIIKATYTKQLKNSIFKLHKDLKSHKYKPSPIKIIHIFKSNGGKKPLGISSVRDKIVQATFKKELEALYEPIFRDCSFGFRPNLSCHSALKRIKKKWQAIKWIISLDISKCFDRVQHEILINTLKQKITDQETIELIRKLLKVGYVDIHNLTKREEYNTKERIPQNSIISPILTNIYFHELDIFIQDKIIPKYSVEDKKLTNNANSDHKNHIFKNKLKENFISQEYPQLKKIIPILKNKKNILNKNTIHYKDKEYYKKLHYIRYTDDLLLGVIGNKEDCQKIISQIKKFFQETLKLKLKNSYINLTKKSLTNFLGFDIKGYENKIILKNTYINNINIKNLTQKSSLSLLIPTKKILELLCKQGYVRKLAKSNRYKGKGVGKLTFVSDKQIVVHFSATIKGYVNYYMCANKRSKL